jgi:hypothetical protein
MMLRFKLTTNIANLTARLASFGSLNEANMTDAMGRSLDDLQNEAVNYMYATFMNPTGPLEDAFYQVITPGVTTEGELINPSSYAWRREKGFEGMYDSLGRGPFHDRGIAYMEHSLGTETEKIEQNFRDALGRTLTEMGA